MPAVSSQRPSRLPHGLGAGDDAPGAQIGAQEGDGMLAQREAEMAIVLDHLAAGGHRPERDGGLIDLRQRFGLARRGGGEQRQRLVAQRLDRPERLAARQAERWPERIGFGETDQRRSRNAGAPPEIIDRCEGPVCASSDDRGGMGVGQARAPSAARAELRSGRACPSAPACSPSGWR